MTYIREATRELNNHDNHVLRISNVIKSTECAICGSTNRMTRKFQINKKHGRGNVITLTVCWRCLHEMRRSFISTKF